MARIRKRGEAQPLDTEERSALLASLAKITGLRLDLGRLDGGQQRRLRELARKALGEEPQEPGRHRLVDPDLLGKRDRKTFETLLEAAASAPGAFEREREALETDAEIRALAVDARRPPARPKLEERGAVVLTRQTAFEFVRDGVLHVDHLLLLVLLQAQFENGETLGQPGARFEGEALVLDSRNTIVPAHFDPNRCLSGRWPKLLEHLVANHFVEIEDRARELRVRPGSRLRKVQKGRRAA
jgi:hypothetical protein